MTASRERGTLFNALLFFLYLAFFTSLFFSFRAITSIAIALLLLAGLVATNNAQPVQAKRPILLFILACLLCFILQFLPFLSGKQALDWKDIQLKSGIVFLPLAAFFSARFSPKYWTRLLQWYCLLLASALVFCISKATISYIHTHDTAVFFYHELVKPIKQHAVFFSIFVLIAIVFLLERIRNDKQLFPTAICWTMLLFFVTSLVLLSSKLVVATLLVTIVYYAIKLVKQRRLRNRIITGVFVSAILIIAIVISTRNPVGRRFEEMFTGDPALVQQEMFNPGTYFTGIQFRLLQWKLVPVILNNDHGWWTGTGSARGQVMLDSQYISRNMYTGTRERGDKGYLGYNTHSQFLESLLRTGIPGAIAFLLLLVALVRMAWSKRQTGYVFIFLLLIIYSLIESVFETQHGQVIIAFFPVFLLMEE